MKVSVSQEHRPTAVATPGRSLLIRLLRLISIALGAFVALTLIFVLFQPEKLVRAITDVEARWGGQIYSYDRSLAEKWSFVIGSYVRDQIEGIPDIPELYIDVPFKGMRRIYQKRDDALQRGNLIQGPDDFVNGSVRVDGRTVPIKLRLKGDWNDHLAGRKWSFRIRIRGGEQLFGMRRFSIQNPATRGFQAELMYFELMRNFGVMSPRYQFVNVTLNGEPVGLMALEEFFAKELLEFNGRREGVIVRFDESLVWQAKDSLAGEIVGWAGAFDDYRNADIDAIGSSRIAESPVLTEQYRVAEGLLRGFVDGRLDTSEVFDVRQLARFIAVSDFIGSWHAIRWPNLRFYLNPITLKLEPIAFDATLQNRMQGEQSVINDDSIVTAMLEDPVVWQEYVATLARLVDLARDGSILTLLRDVEAGSLKLLQSEFRMLGQYPIDYLLPRGEYLLARMSAADPANNPNLYFFAPWETALYPTFAHFRIQRSNAGEYLEVENAIPRDVAVTAIDWVNDAIGERESAVTAVLPIGIPPRGVGSAGERFEIELLPAPSTEGWVLEVSSGITGRPWFKTSRPQRANPALSRLPIPDSTVDEQLATHAFLTLDEAQNHILVPSGDWAVNESLVVPQGYELHIAAGTTMRFANNAALVAFGSVRFAGTPDAPVDLTSANGKSWPGMVVMNALAPSVLEHVIVSNTHSVVLPGWTLTGGVNFYMSDVELVNCEFRNSLGEDALNIVHSNFEIRNIVISGTASDAFDADFSTGRIVGGQFIDIGKAGGGDAIDVSGSHITVEGVEFVRIVDKSLSAGERSEMTVADIVIQETGTGAAAKDGSVLRISNSRIVGASFAAMTAYIKKPEYGSATILANNVQIDATDIPVLAQTGNQISVDGVAAETRDINVGALYETVMKPGLPK